MTALNSRATNTKRLHSAVQCAGTDAQFLGCLCLVPAVALQCLSDEFLLEACHGPMQVKQAVTGYGKAVKKQVQEMTRILLHLPAIPKPDDTADALAMAITFCHTNGSQLNRFVRRVPGPI